MNLDNKKLRAIFLGIAGCIVLSWLLHEPERISSWAGAVGAVISPFVVGAVLAFVLNVPMRGIERKLSGVKKNSLRRGLAIVLTMLVVLLVIAGVVWLLVPRLGETLQSLITQLPGFFTRLKESAQEFLEKHPDIMEFLNKNTSINSINWSSMLQQAVTWLTGSLSTILGGTITTVIGVGTGIFNAILSLVFGLYCLARKEVLASQARRIIYAFLPEKFCDETVRILRMTNTSFSNFISGQCLEAVILGAMFAVTMPIFRMPYMPLISVIIAITALIPIVGAFTGCVVGALFILVDSPIQAVWFVVLFLVLQQIEGNLIYPRVVGTSIGLPGMWVLVAVAVGGSLMGVSGMLLMIPVAAVLYALLREITQKRLAVRNVDSEKLKPQPPELRSRFKEAGKKRKEKRDKQKTKEADQK